MSYYAEQNDNNITPVYCLYNDVPIQIGIIEKPYSFDHIYIAIGHNQETLRNGDSFIFSSFETAYNKVIEAYEGRLEGEILA